MKKRLYFTVLAIASSTLMSCGDYLDRTSFDSIGSGVEVTETVAIALTNGCYSPLQSSNMYNQRIPNLDIVAGNAIVGAGGGTDGIETTQVASFIATADNQMATYMWRSPWVGIQQCNIVIQDVGASSISTDIKDRCIGEARFLRAHYYFTLVQLFGGVPIRSTPATSDMDVAIARNTLSECYNFIVDDCIAAANILPTKSEYASSDLGRATKEAAQTMLAKVYLVLAEDDASLYDDVVTLCESIESAGYSLNSAPYANNFNCENTSSTYNANMAESIFEVQYSGSTQYDFWGNNCQSSWLSAFTGPRNSGMVAGSWGWMQPTEEYMSHYEAGDLRKDITTLYDGCPQYSQMDYDPSWSLTGYNTRKFLVSKTLSADYNTSAANFVVYRYADVVLMRAEALNESNELALAQAALNEVRSRAGLGNTPASNKEDLREAIIKERRVELAFEGHRWFDLIRLEKGAYAIEFLHSIGQTNATLQRLLLPIPQTELDANSLMTQNPGY